MKTKKTSRKILAIILSIIMVVLTLNVSTVSAYSKGLNDNIKIADTAQVNIVDGNENVVEQNTVPAQATTVSETQPITEEHTEPPTQETQPATEKATVEVNKNSNDPTLNIATGSIRLRSSDSSLQYQQGDGAWITYTGEFTIEGTTSTDAKGNTIVEATKNTVTVESGAHNITLSNINIDLIAEYSITAFDIQGTSSVILTLAEGTTNTIKGGYYRAAVQVQFKDNKTANVEIKGNGTLVAQSAGYGAGIGGASENSAGTIAISGNANVSAIGGAGAAGIGGGYKGDGGTITISDNAIVTATTGENNGAGIGGGSNSAGGIITISDNAKVTATSTEAGAGIGGGGYTGNAGIITIKDSAEVTAIGGDEGAGIGLGLVATEGTVIIRDTATVTAIGGPSGAGIGGGSYAQGGTITISHAAKVTAIGGKAKNSNYTYPSAIGSGSNEITGHKVDGSTLKIGADATVIAVPQGNGIAIDNKGAITAPDGEDLANILQLNYETELLAGTETALFNQDITEFSYTPDVNYKAMAITGVDETTTYNVVLTNDANIKTMQQGINENNSESEYTIAFIANDNDKYTNYNQINEADVPYNPIININKGSIKFRTDSLEGKQYSIGEFTNESLRVWTTYRGEVTIEGTTSTDAQGNVSVEETTNTVTVESGTHNITLSNVSINVSEIDNSTAFDIQGTSGVKLTLAEGSTNILNSGDNQAGLQVQTKDNKIASVEIKGNGALLAKASYGGAGIGGATDAAGGAITISGTAKVTAIAGNILNNTYNYPSAIGSGSYLASSGVKPEGATLKIGAETTVIAVAQGNGLTIDSNGAITAPDGEEQANILQSNYLNPIPAYSQTAVFDGNTEVVSIAPDVEYQSIAFSGLDENTTYNVYKTANNSTTKVMQEGIKDNSSEYTIGFVANDNDKFTNYNEIKDAEDVVIEYNPSKNINDNSIKFRSDSVYGAQYSIGEVADESTREWTIYRGEFTIEGTNSTDAQGNVTVEETTNTVTVESGKHNITLSNVNINVSDINKSTSFDIQGTSSVILTLAEGSTNTLKSGYEQAGIQVQTKNKSTASLEIKGNGSLEVNAGYYGAGIGGGRYGDSGGTITISDNATVTATGGTQASGIGGGYQGDGGTIIISDNAAVTATGGASGAGIGGGYSGTGGTITIGDTAKVIATAGTYGAGIGGGYSGTGGTIAISDSATVTAISDGTKQPIDDSNGSITAATETEISANIIELNFKYSVSGETEVIEKTPEGNAGELLSYTTNETYKSIAFTGVNNSTEYSVELNDVLATGKVQGIEEESTTFSTTNESITIINELYAFNSEAEANPTLNVLEGSIYIIEENNINYYRQESKQNSYTPYTGEITINSGGETTTDEHGNTLVKETTNTITVESGTHDITLSNVNINVSEILNGTAFDIQGTSSVNLTLAEGSTNTLKSGENQAGLQVQTKDNRTASVNIKGSGALTVTGGSNGAGIGGGDSGAGGTITIGDTAKVTATGGYNGAGIGGGRYSKGGNITISGSADVTATGNNGGAGIGGGYNSAGDTITIRGNATVTSTGGERGAGIGGGYQNKGGTIIIGDSAIVTSTGGEDGAGIGGGYRSSVGSTIAISDTAKVISVSDGEKQPIDAIDNTITAPEGEKVANILQLNYQSSVVANSQTALFDSATKISSFTPDKNYKSIAFSGLDMNKTYTVGLNKVVQQGQKDASLTSEFVLTQGLNTYTNVQSTTDELKKVSFVNTDGDVLAEEYVVTGGTAPRPVLPLLRKEIYVQDFEDSEFENITTDKTLVYKKVPKIVSVSTYAEYVDKLDITVNNKTVDTEVVYGEIVKATYTGEGSVIGWKINEHVVSVTNSKTYAFYIVETSIIQPILEGTAIEEVDINVGVASYSTEADNKTKAYYPIVAAGYHDATEVKYGVIRSTVESDVTEENIREYLVDTTQQANSNIVREYTDTNVMNGDGRYNYVAVMPTDTDKTLYVKAWIEVDGVLYVSEYPIQNP